MDRWFIETNKLFKGKGCPYEEGYEVLFNDFKVELGTLVFPPQWTGIMKLDL